MKLPTLMCLSVSGHQVYRVIDVRIADTLNLASVGFTMDVYSHIIEGMQKDAMALLDEVLPAGVFQSFNAKS